MRPNARARGKELARGRLWFNLNDEGSFGATAMRSHLTTLVLGLGILAASIAPGLACAFHDQQASATQQQTADAQQQSSTKTQ
jgi:hypothetical protein